MAEITAVESTEVVGGTEYSVISTGGASPAAILTAEYITTDGVGGAVEGATARSKYATMGVYAVGSAAVYVRSSENDDYMYEMLTDIAAGNKVEALTKVGTSSIRDILMNLATYTT